LWFLAGGGGLWWCWDDERDCTQQVLKTS